MLKYVLRLNFNYDNYDERNNTSSRSSSSSNQGNKVCVYVFVNLKLKHYI